MSKNFRLFISSTFSDFLKEREVLQTKVFPDIKEYAQEKGYSFQPIDLRWGVSSEAQIDQKTIQLCLEEVRTSKLHLSPNFLIMIGDRYGWIPLPYTIEKEEFKEILLHVEKDKELLQEWYELDKNQLPASYILKQREGSYEDYDTWEKVENSLRETVQNAVNKSNLSKEQKKKYFLSATEAEVEEGIIPYDKPTEFQEKNLLKKDPNLLNIDPKHIFGLFRDMDSNSKQKDKFISDEQDYHLSKTFKTKVKEHIEKENSLHVETKQINEESLDEEYLEEFEAKIITFLKKQIDEQKEKDEQNKKSLTSLEIEQEAQNLYLQQKAKNFLMTNGLEKLLQDIENHIDSKEDNEAFVIYASSGKGKSSLITQAIYKTQERLKERVIYRFVGATPNMSNSKELLLSIFEELGMELEKVEKESFEEFSLRAYDAFFSIKEEVVIYIDAIDQLQNEDNLLWLPKTLPLHVKLIITALEDENYEKDSQYFLFLKQKSTNIHSIPDFEKPVELLKKILKNEHRTIQEEQKEYFLKQYQKANSPLYVFVASQEIKHWKSNDNTQKLNDTQREIIKEFISNLSTIYHHEKEFVQKTLGYIYASKYGLSESELLQLFSTDEEFIEKMAPEKFHKNTTKELPLVHWSRLQTQLKPFFSQKTKDNEELMYFFHREFEDVIKEMPNQRDEHEAIIKATQKMILKNQDKDFDQNRWGKLYAILVAEYELRYEDEAKQEEFSLFLASEELDEGWVAECFNNINDIAVYHQNRMEIKESIVYHEINYFFIKKLYQKEPSIWIFIYIPSLGNLAGSYSKDHIQIEKAIELRHKALDILEIKKDLYQEDQSMWVKDYVINLSSLVNLYQINTQLEKAIELGHKALKILEINKNLYQKDQFAWVKLYAISLNNLATSYEEKNQLPKAIELGHKALKILEINKNLYQKKLSTWEEYYARSLNNLATSYYKKNQLPEAIEFGNKALKIREDWYQIHEYIWAKDYTESLNNLVIFYKDSNELDKAIEFGNKALKITENKYKISPYIWVEYYARSLNNLAISYQDSNELPKAIEFGNKALKAIEGLYIEIPSSLIKDYMIYLNNLATAYFMHSTIDESLKLLNKNYAIHEKIYGKDDDRTKEVLLTLKIVKNKSKEATKKEKNKATFEDLLYLSKFISLINKEDEINMVAFVMAFGSIEFNEKARSVFSQIYNIEEIEEYTDAQKFITDAKKLPDIPYNNELKELVVQLKEIFGDEPIGYFR